VATFNEILAGRFNRFSQKHFNLKGRDGTPTLGADVLMQMSFQSGIENRYLEGWDVCGRSNAVVATAAQFSVIQLSNPAGSGVVGVCTRWLTSTITADVQAQLILIRNFTSQQPNPRTNSTWDLRGRPVGSLVFTDSNGAAPNGPGGTATPIVVINLPANSNVELIPAPLEVPLLPGTALEYSTGAANEAVACAVWWRERALEDSEKF
jgi:hypothetical protein